MKDQSKTKQVLIQELVSLRQRVEELEQSESERKRVDDALRLDSEILANMNEGIQLTRIDDGVIVYTNRSFEVLFGYDPGELVGNHVSILNAPGAKSPEDVANEIIKSLNQAGVWNGEIHNLRKDGTSFWCYVNISKFKYQRYGDVWISVHQDITERKRAEEELHVALGKYRVLFDAFPLGISITDAVGHIIETNRESERLLGISREEQTSRTYVGSEWQIICPDGTPMPVHEYASVRAMKENCLVENVEMGIVKGDQTITWINVTAAPIPLKNFGVAIAYGDITERKKAEEARRQSEENFHRSLDESPLGVRIVTVEGETIYANRAILDIYGYDSLEELKNTPIAKRYTPESYLEFQTRREQRRHGFEGPSEYVISIIRKDGSIRHLQVYRKEILWNNKEQYQVLYRDITERKRVEEALRESEEQFRLLAEQSLMVIGIIQDGLFKYFNKVYEEITGYSADEIKRWKPFEFSKTIHPDDLHFVIDQVRNKQDGHPGVVPHYSFRGVRKNGDIRWIEIYSKTVTYKKKPADLVTLIDVTERKKAEEALRKSEERYRTLIETTRDLIYTTDRRGYITYMNPALEKIMGYTPHELNGRSFAEILAPDFVDKTRDIFRRAMKGELIPVYEAEMIRKDGKKLSLEFNVETLYDEKGKPVGRSGVGRDITERRRAEDEMKASYQQLRALAKRLQQIREESQIMIAREIHDELGGGLTGLKMDLSLLSQKIEDEKEGKDHDFLMKRIHSANQLINGLIQNVRLIGTKLRPSVLDDLGLIAALEWESEEFTNRTGIQCEFVPAFEYVTLEETTATAVFRIFQEALTNVARHSGADKVTVLFREDGGYLYLEVMDNGRGITEGEILNMKSLGVLGMRERALVFGGELSISGEPGRGTTVVLKIPQGREKSS